MPHRFTYSPIRLKKDIDQLALSVFGFATNRNSLEEMEVNRDLRGKDDIGVNENQRKKVLLRFRSRIHNFRIPELDSIAKLFNTQIKYDKVIER